MPDRERREAVRAWEANPRDPQLANAAAKAYERDGVVPPGWISAACLEGPRLLSFPVTVVLTVAPASGAELDEGWYGHATWAPRSDSTPQAWRHLEPGQEVCLPAHHHWFAAARDEEDTPALLQHLGRLPACGLELHEADQAADLAQILPSLRWLSLTQRAAATAQLPRTLSDIGPRLWGLALDEAPGLGARAMESLAAAEHLGTLRLSGLGRLRDDDLAPLAALSELATLEILGSKQLRGSGLKHLSGLPRLQRLGLWSCKGLDLRQLPALPALRELSVPLKQERDYAALTALNELTALACDGSGIGIEALVGKLTRLECLTLGDVSTRGLQQACGLEDLRELQFHCGARISDKGLRALPRLRRLRLLRLLGSGKKLTAFETLSELRELEELVLIPTIETNDLADFLALPKLRRLTLNCLYLSDGGTTLPSSDLVELDAKGWPALEGQLLKQLVDACPRLRRLRLARVRLQPDDLRVLDRLPDLEELSLQGEGVAAAAARSLSADHPRLARVRLIDPEPLDPQDEKAIQRCLSALPRLELAEVYDRGKPGWTRIEPDEATGNG
jgi:hypothetical protein